MKQALILLNIEDYFFYYLYAHMCSSLTEVLSFPPPKTEPLVSPLRV